MNTFPWKTAWVVGASSGIGRSTAAILARGGVRVAASARDKNALRDLAEASSGNISAFPLDVTDADLIVRTASAIEDSLGPIDLAILSAGIWRPFDLDTFDPDDFRANIDVNYLGTVNTIAALLPLFRSRGVGHIAIVASVAGYFGLPKAATYAPTKAALISLGECLRSELQGSGVTVSVVNPGFVDTRLAAKNDFPMPFLMQPDDAAERLVRGLASGRFEIAFPRRFAWLLKAIRMVPYPVFFWGVRNLLARR